MSAALSARIERDDLGRQHGKPWIVCAALRHTSGLIVAGARHWDAVMQGMIGEPNFNDWQESEQGFIDQHGNFYSRSEAAQLATRNQQTAFDLSGTILTSEDLY